MRWQVQIKTTGSKLWEDARTKPQASELAAKLQAAELKRMMRGFSFRVRKIATENPEE